MLQSSTAINTGVAQSLRASTEEDKQVQFNNVHRIPHYSLLIHKKRCSDLNAPEAGTNRCDIRVSSNTQS